MLKTECDILFNAFELGLCEVSRIFVFLRLFKKLLKNVFMVDILSNKAFLRAYKRTMANEYQEMDLLNLIEQTTNYFPANEIRNELVE